MMSMYNKDGMMIGQYLQIPNSFVDRIVGPVCSGNAAWVVVTVWRYTHGIKDKNKGRRQSAKIPAETFMRVLGTDREKTIYKYVKEAEETGLIEVTRKRGATNTYSINLKSKHWYDVEDVIVLDEGDSKVLAESATPLQVLAESATPLQVVAKSASGEKRHTTRAESATPFDESTGEKRHPYKESSLNKSFKEEAAPAKTDFDFLGFYEQAQDHLKLAGMIPTFGPVNDTRLKPEIYKFVQYHNGQGTKANELGKRLISWFQKFSKEEMRAFFIAEKDLNSQPLHASHQPSVAQQAKPHDPSAVLAAIEAGKRKAAEKKAGASA